MTERERILAMREGAIIALTDTTHSRATQPEHKYFATEYAIRRFPLPKRIIPTVQQGTAEGGKWWYRVFFDVSYGLNSIIRYAKRDDALRGAWPRGSAWLPEDQPVVAHLLTLPLTEEVEDTGNE